MTEEQARNIIKMTHYSAEKSRGNELPARIETVHCFGAAAGALVALHKDLLGDREVIEVDADSFVRDLPRATALLCHEPPANAWHLAENLRLIQTLSVGLDSLLPAPGLPEQVTICNTSGLSAPAMAEFAVAQLLVMVKRFPQAWGNQQSRAWSALQPGSLRGRTIAVLGTGAVGRELAHMLSGLGCTVVGFTRRPRPIHPFSEVCGLDQLVDVLARCDDVVVALPAVPATRHLLNAHTLGALRPGGHVVNIARGDLVDETALITLLRSGHLAGAALDTVQQEPLPEDSPLWTTPGTIITPHVSWFSASYTRDVVALFATNVAALENGSLLTNVVDRALGVHQLPD